MTGKEFLLNVINHQAVDRVAVVPFIHANFVRAFYENPNVDLIAKTVEVYEHFGLDIIHRNCTPARDHIGPCGDRWEVEKTVEKKGRDETTTTVVHTPMGDLNEINRVNWVSEYDVEASPVD